ncbi:hypothetical protein Tco_1089754, partial [Tanacetum coccineum]
KNERDSKKVKEKVVEPSKKKKKPAKCSKKKNKADEQSPKKITTYNLYDFDYNRLFAQWSNPMLTFVPSDNEFVQSWCIDSFQYFTNRHESFQRDSVGEVLVQDVEQEHNLICRIGETAVETSQFDLNIHSNDHVQDLSSAYQDMDKDSNIHCDDHVEDQNSPFQDMDKESNIHSHDHVEHQNLPNMCKEHVLVEFDAIKETVDIIDKRKGEVSTSCLEKELDIVKDRIAVLEKCFKLSDSAISDVFHQEVASEKRDWPGEASVLDCTQLEVDTLIDWSLPNFNEPFSQSHICGSVGFNDMLDPSCKDHQLNDSVPIGLGKPVDMMFGEVNKYDDKLGETLNVGVIVDCATLQSSPPPNAMDNQDPQPTDKVTAKVFVQVEQNSSFQDMDKDSNIHSHDNKGVDMMYGEDNTSDDKLDETVAVGVIVDRATPQSSPHPNAMEYQEPEPTDKGSVGFDDLLDPRFKDQLLNDNVPKGLVKLVEPMSGEDNISDDKLDETVAAGVIFNLSTYQASPPPNAM